MAEEADMRLTLWTDYALRTLIFVGAVVRDTGEELAVMGCLGETGFYIVGCFDLWDRFSLRRLQRSHWVLLGLSLLTVFGAVAGSHGWCSRPRHR